MKTRPLNDQELALFVQLVAGFAASGRHTAEGCVSQAQKAYVRVINDVEVDENLGEKISPNTH